MFPQWEMKSIKTSDRTFIGLISLKSLRSLNPKELDSEKYTRNETKFGPKKKDGEKIIYFFIKLIFIYNELPRTFFPILERLCFLLSFPNNTFQIIKEREKALPFRFHFQFLILSNQESKLSLLFFSCQEL